MTRDRTHYVGDGCRPAHDLGWSREAERVTAADLDEARKEAARIVSRSPADYYRILLETAFRPGGIVDRAVAAELGRLAAECEDWADEAHGYPAWLREQAAEWREGKR